MKKNRAWLEILLNWMERGLISRKNRGFCARVEALTGIWIWLTRLDLFWTVDLGSDGWGLTNAGKRRRRAPEVRARGGASPASSDPALRGLIRAGVWPWSTAVACVVQWRARTGGAGLGEGVSPTWAARRRWNSAGERGRGTSGVPHTKTSSATERRGRGDAHQAWKRAVA